MAYTLPNTGIIRPWNVSKNRYIHRRLKLTIAADGTASGLASIPAPGRLVSITYGGPNATESRAVGAALTGGALVLKSETTAGVQIWTDADLSSVATIPIPVGSKALDETNAATAATDGFSGGFPVRSGVHASITGGTEAEVLVVDLYFRLCTYVKGELVAQSGADGSAVVTRTVRLGNAGVLSALAFDFQNMPATTDIVIKADGSSGNTLFTWTSSATDTTDAAVNARPNLLGSPGKDEAINASAATDGTECGLAFQGSLYIDVAQADAFTQGDEKIVFELWIDD